MLLKNVQKLLLLLMLSPALVSASTSNHNLQKIGEGTSYYLKIFKVYDASLYSSDSPGDRNILSNEVSKCLQLEYDVDINKEIIIESAIAALNRQFPAEVLTEFSRDIELINQRYQDVQKGDSYTLCYNRDTHETTLAFNDSIVVSITSPGFAEVYFSIWLDEDEPLDKSLRDDLLSG
jgi:hypothetical protein